METGLHEVFNTYNTHHRVDTFSYAVLMTSKWNPWGISLARYLVLSKDSDKKPSLFRAMTVEVKGRVIPDACKIHSLPVHLNLNVLKTIKI